MMTWQKEVRKVIPNHSKNYFSTVVDFIAQTRLTNTAQG